LADDGGKLGQMVQGSEAAKAAVSLRNAGGLSVKGRI
jgi:hypothetical protein